MVIYKFLITLLSIFVISLTLSVDDFAVGIGYGLHKIKMPPKNLLLMVLGSAISTWGVMLLGKFIFTFIPDSIADFIGVIILGAIGCKMIYQGLTEKESYEKYINNNPISPNTKRTTSVFELMSVGFALGIDDFAQALGLGVAGFPVALTVILLEVAEIIAILSGNYLAFKGFSKKVNGRLSIIPGIVLILVGLYQLFF